MAYAFSIEGAPSLDAPLPSYETMIVATLQALDRPQGAPPKDIFNYMMEHWPLIPNFRPSATQALQRALKRGRLMKEGCLYCVNPTWTSGHTAPDETRPARHLAKRPASVFAPRLPQVDDTRQHNTMERLEFHSDTNSKPPVTKATAQAAATLLRSIADEMAAGTTDTIERPAPTSNGVMESLGITASNERVDAYSQTAEDGSHETPDTMHIRTPRRLGRPATGVSPRPKIPHSAIPPPISFPTVEHPPTPLDEKRIQKSLIVSLEAIVSQLRVLRNEPTPTLR